MIAIYPPTCHICIRPLARLHSDYQPREDFLFFHLFCYFDWISEDGYDAYLEEHKEICEIIVEPEGERVVFPSPKEGGEKEEGAEVEGDVET